MKKTYFLLFLLTLFVGTASVYGSEINATDYQTIQDAIDAANDSDVIIVKDGTYYENLVINKSITLKSENGSENCIIDGNNSGNVIKIEVDNVTIEGFTIRNSGNTHAGIDVNSDNNIIKNNKILNNGNGIYLNYSSNNIITNSTISNNGDGIYLEYSSNNNSITNNNITSNNYCGIRLWYSSNNNIIIGNNISNNYHSIYLHSSSNNNIIGNNISNNRDDGIYLYISSNNNISGNNISNNRDYGINLGHYSNNNIIIGNNISNNIDDGIYLEYSNNNNSIINNNISNNRDGGIYLEYSSNNRITNNNITSNNYSGIYLSSSSNNNIIDNAISKNMYNGIYLHDSSNNGITNNNISNNSYGISLGGSSNNRIIDNIISKNRGNGIHLGNSNNNSINSNNITLNNNSGIRLAYSSNNNIINDNNITSNNWNGIFLDSSSNNHIIDNTFINDDILIEGWMLEHWIHTIENNTINGKPLYYFKNKVGGNISDAGQVILVNCSDVIVENLKISNISVGIDIAYSSNITVKNNVLSNNSKSIRLWSSSNNTIIGNDISKNMYNGIYLWYSSNNIIYLNNFNNNSQNVYFYYSTNNTWNSPEEITYTYNGAQYTNYLGNYWSDYMGGDTNGDGIGDARYTIKWGIFDYYPLILEDLKPNLLIYDIIKNTPIYNGIQTEINLSIINNGNEDITTTFPVEITIENSSGDAVYTNTMNISGLSAGAMKNITFNWTPNNIGTYRIIALVDPNNIINESNEYDNDYYSKYFSVINVPGPITKPNLKIVNIATNTTIYSGIQTEINLTIINNGNENINTTFPVEITIKNTSGDAVYTNVANINGLNAGESRTLTFSWTPNNIGNYNITAFVDPNNIINESNESDNNYNLSNVEICGFENESSNSETIVLKKGWNILSIPHRANISFSNPEAVGSIMTYYNNTWYNESNLEPLYGYYIYCNNDTIMNIKYITSEEPTAPPARPVFKGWNLVGVNPGQYDIDGVILIDFVLPVEDSWIMILDPENSDLYTKNDYIFSILLHSYDAYWMYNKENDILPGRNLN